MYWDDGGQNMGLFPVLSRLDRDVLSIQVSTVASESAFSAGEHVVDPFRSRLEHEVIEALICTMDWTTTSERGSKEEKIASHVDGLDIEMVAKAIELEDYMVVDIESD